MTKAARKPKTVPPEQIGMLRSWYPKYKEAKARADKSISLQTVADETGYNLKTVRKYFKKWEVEDIEKAKTTTPTATTPTAGTVPVPPPVTPESETAKEAVHQRVLNAVANESTKVIDMAIALGSLLATEYRPIIEVLESKDKGPKEIITEIMNWYEKKPEKEKELDKKEFAILVLTQKIKDLSQMTYPTYWAEVKANLFYKYAKDLLVGRVRGMPISVSKATKAFQDELLYIEAEMLKKQEELAKKDSLEGLVWQK